MRFVTWNCHAGRFQDKATKVAELKPAILAVQEIEYFDHATKFLDVLDPSSREHCAAEGFPRRGFGMFSFGDIRLVPLDGSAPFSGFRRYEAAWGDHQINVVGVGPWATRSVSTSYRQAHEGLRANPEWIQLRETVILGDFNASGGFRSSRNVRNWKELLGLTNELGLISAYHEYTGESFGGEKLHTHFQRGSDAHLDYCFIPQAWRSKIAKVTVGSSEEWRSLSDHMPLIVDIKL
jgi:endonuclease/exonuclease/phosphatase family metal-dependent hydrolase